MAYKNNGKAKSAGAKSAGAAAAAARGVKAAKGNSRGNSRGKKEVVALSYSDIPKYKAARAGAYGAAKYAKGDKGGKKDYNSMPFRNKDIDRITNPKMTKQSYGDYIRGLD